MMRFTFLSVFFVCLWMVNDGHFLCRKYKLYMDERSYRLLAVELGPGPGGIIANCEDYGQLTYFQTLYFRFLCLERLDKAGMRKIEKTCPQIKQSRLLLNVLLDKLG